MLNLDYLTSDRPEDEPRARVCVCVFTSYVSASEEFKTIIGNNIDNNTRIKMLALYFGFATIEIAENSI